MNEKFADEALAALDAQSVQDAKKFADEAVPKVKAMMLDLAALGFPTMVTSLIPATMKDGRAGYHHAVAYTPEFATADRATTVATAILTGSLAIPNDIMDMFYGITLKMLVTEGKKQAAPGCQGRTCTREQMIACDKAIDTLAARVKANEPGIFTSTEEYTSPCGDKAPLRVAACAMRDTLTVADTMAAVKGGRASAPTTEDALIDQLFGNAQAPAPKPAEAVAAPSEGEIEEKAAIASLDGDEPNDGLAHQFLYNTPKNSGKFN